MLHSHREAKLLQHHLRSKQNNAHRMPEELTTKLPSDTGIEKTASIQFMYL